jgi:hypothetical protein
VKIRGGQPGRATERFEKGREIPEIPRSREEEKSPSMDIKKKSII